MRMLRALKDESEDGGGHGSGMMRWLLTYSDMLTLLFALFIVMYGIAQVERCGKLRQLENVLTEKFKKNEEKVMLTSMRQTLNMEELVKSINPREGGVFEQTEDDLLLISQKLYTELKKQNLNHLVQFHLVERGLVLSMLTDKLLFDLGDSELRSESSGVLDKITAILKSDDHDVRIEGHTCNLPILPCSRFRSNWELSTMRAASVAEYLVRSNGIDPNRVSLVGYGEYRPLYPNEGEENRMKNRRVDIILLRKKTEKVENFHNYKLSPYETGGGGQ
ncbi:MAG: flagellar motor protein MotB [Candidatus Xenobiia bacterium LiM19]